MKNICVWKCCADKGFEARKTNKKKCKEKISKHFYNNKKYYCCFK